MPNLSRVIHSDPSILSGTPVFVGTRVPAQSLIDYLAAGDTLNKFLDAFPSVKREQAVAALEWAREALLGVRVLLDESVPRQLANELRGHEMQTVVQVGWTGIQNGELLRRGSEAGFEVLVTMDQNLEHQQNIAQAGLGVIVLLARDSRVETVLHLSESIRSALTQVRPGIVVHVGA